MGIFNEEDKKPIFVVAAFVVALLAYTALTIRDQRDASPNVADVALVLPQGVDTRERQSEELLREQMFATALKKAEDRVKDKAQTFYH